MRVQRRRDGAVRLRLEHEDDLYHLDLLLEPGDSVRASTERREATQADRLRPGRGAKQKMTLTLAVEKVEYQPFGQRLRCHGPITEASRDVGQHHTLLLGAGDDLVLGNPVPAVRQVSHDPTLRQTIMLRDGRRATALEIQFGLLERAQKYAQTHGLEPVGADVGHDVLARWEAMLSALETDPDSVADQVDWVAKRRLVDGFRSRHDLPADSPKLKAIDLQYHDLRTDRGLAYRVGLQTVADAAAVTEAITEPPTTTRAYFRGRCLQKFPDDIVAANWDSMVFDVGRDPLRRVPMMEPLRGTAHHVATLIDESTTAAELLDRLGA